jgi:hypothetical protein
MGWVLRPKKQFLSQLLLVSWQAAGRRASDTFANTFVSGIFCIMRAAGSCRLWTISGENRRRNAL